MKIIIINGSPRAQGATACILKIMQTQLQQKDGVQIHFYHLAQLDLAYCTGCSHCFRSGKCILDDDLEALSNDLADADGVLIGSPTYASNLSAQLKTFVDRGHLVMEQLLAGKYAVGVITNENYGSGAAAGILKSIFAYSGASVSAMLKQKLPFSNAPQFSQKEIARFQKAANRLYQDVKKQHRYPLQRILHRLTFQLGIKPFVEKKGAAYQGVHDRWKSQTR